MLMSSAAIISSSTVPVMGVMEMIGNRAENKPMSQVDLGDMSKLLKISVFFLNLLLVGG